MPFCGGPLYSADYQRKPRGGPPQIEEAFQVRFSLCCGAEGCRRRVMPASVRFWDRRVYWAPVVLLVTALRQGRNPQVTLARVKALCGGLWRCTVKRWQHYFRDLFCQSIRYRRLAGKLIPPIQANQLPGQLLDRFCNSGGQPEAALANCLRALVQGL